MKKVYHKPAIVFESFALTTSIAGTCQWFLLHASADSCAVADTKHPDENTWTVFLNDNVCMITDVTSDDFCYHVPSGNYQTFNS